MKNNKNKAIEAIKKMGKKVNTKLNERGFGVENIATDTGNGGFTHKNEIKFGKFGKVDAPSGRISYAKEENKYQSTLPGKEIPQLTAKSFQKAALKKGYKVPKTPKISGIGWK